MIKLKKIKLKSNNKILMTFYSRDNEYDIIF
jgi:hypothetical protein